MKKYIYRKFWLQLHTKIGVFPDISRNHLCNQVCNQVGAGRYERTEKMKPLKVLIACEESQRVCIEFRKLGHEAYSADIQEPSGSHPEWHIHCDVLKVLNAGGSSAP